jgi:hypothetical protein
MLSPRLQRFASSAIRPARIQLLAGAAVSAAAWGSSIRHHRRYCRASTAHSAAPGASPAAARASSAPRASQSGTPSEQLGLRLIAASVFPRYHRSDPKWLPVQTSITSFSRAGESRNWVDQTAPCVDLDFREANEQPTEKRSVAGGHAFLGAWFQRSPGRAASRGVR